MEKDVATEAWIPFLQSEYNLIGPQLNGPNHSLKKYRNKKIPYLHFYLLSHLCLVQC